MPNTRMMHIGELAEHSGLSLRTIRHYDEIGLLTPSGRSEGGFRLYTADDLSRLMLIRRMKPLGYSLEQMGDLLAALDTTQRHEGREPDARQTLEDFLVDARERREKLASHLSMADEFIGLLSERSGAER